MKNQKIIVFILLSYLFISCCDCLDETEPPKPFCSPREATVTKFDPTLIQVVLQDINGNDSIVYYPTDAYSIHGFEFPQSKSSSGNLPIDNGRYSSEAGRDRVAIAQSALPEGVFRQFPVFLAVLSNLPANEDINGDFIVSDVDLTDPNDPIAFVRFKGWLDFVDDNLFSESSQDFCDFYENQFEPKDYSPERFGKNKPRAITRNPNSNVISLIDSRGNILIENIANPTIRLTGGAYNLNEIQLWGQITGALLGSGIGNIFNSELVDSLRNESERKEIVDIQVRIGDAFYYQSIRGKGYLIQFQNIAERNINGIKRRVSFMFTDI